MSFVAEIFKALFKDVLAFIVQDRLKAWMPRMIESIRALYERLGKNEAPGVPVAFEIKINTTLPRLRVHGQGHVSQGPS